jgi:very-short-patch-repair endonuclease
MAEPLPELRVTSPLPLAGEGGAQRRVRGQKVERSAVLRARSLRRRETDAEYRLWRYLRNRGLGGFKFLRQHPIDRFVADFVCRDKMLVVELDGGQHNESESDELRTAFLNDAGYSVLRFWNNEVLANTDGVLEALLNVLEHGPSPGLRFAPATLSPEGRGDFVASPSGHLAPLGRGRSEGPGEGPFFLLKGKE